MRFFAAETKTDPTRDIYVENSTTNFVLTAKVAPAEGKSVVGFELSGPPPGHYTLVCFINGREFRQEPFVLPGTYKLTTRGMDKGTHRITVQLIDKAGNVGSCTHKIEFR